MAVEIERKFLVKNNSFKQESFAEKSMKQGYLNSNKNRTVRIRITDDKAFITVKGNSNSTGVSRFEWEKEIDKLEAEELLLLCETTIIEKNRFYVKSHQHVYEIDEFFGDNYGLIIAEVELKNEDEAYTKPLWLGEEVTGRKKYYNSKFKSPKVITMLTNLDYENRVIYADSLLLISLDSYLGKNHKFYNDYPTYIKENNSKDHIIVDVAKEIINTQFKPTGKFNNRSFLAKIIFEGKKMYFLDLYLPFVSEKEKSGYSLDKLIWAKNNEEEVWKIFIEKEFLYSTDTNLNKRFIENAPFSKFYTSQDNESPGKIGVYIGWQIVKSYMNNNDVSLQKLIQIDSQSLFAKSRYKPIK